MIRCLFYDNLFFSFFLLQNQMNELVNQQPNASKDQIFNQVVGEHTKSTLTYGHGIRKVDVFGTQSF